MKKQIGDYLVAAGVIAATAVLLGALTVALTGFRLDKPRRVIEVDFPDVAGIRLHSEARYAGAPAGRVTAIRPLSLDERRAGGPEANRNAVRVTLEIDNGVPPIPSDTVASLGSDTLLSEKYVAFTAGSPDAPPLASGAVLRGKPGFSIESITGTIAPIVRSADETVLTVKQAVADLMPQIHALVQSTNRTAAGAAALVGRADQLVDGNDEAIAQRIEELGGALRSLESAAAQSRTTLQSADRLIGGANRQIDARMQELSVVLQNLKVASTHLKAATQTVAERPSRILWGSPPAALTPEEDILSTRKPLPATKPQGDSPRGR